MLFRSHIKRVSGVIQKYYNTLNEKKIVSKHKANIHENKTPINRNVQNLHIFPISRKPHPINWKLHKTQTNNKYEKNEKRRHRKFTTPVYNCVGQIINRRARHRHNGP